MTCLNRPGAGLTALALIWGAAVHAEGTACTDMAKAAPEGVTITSVTEVPKDDDSPTAHCLVTGEMGARTGMDGQPYKLRFELRLPDAWEGRFMHQFNGGNDGEVKPALGDGTGVRGTALERGFAVVSSDAGHDGKAQKEKGLTAGNMFGYDFEARRDYGYGAVAKLNPIAMQLTEAHYGRAPDYTYGYGRSNGGRHAMVAAERMPEAFDGLLAGYPGFNLPKAALQHAWDVQTFRSVGDDLASSFSPKELGTVRDGIVAACDRLDGLEDGVIFDITGCQSAFDPGSLACSDGQNSDCLAPEKVAALEKIHAGPSNSKGERLYNSWVWDTGLASGNWRFWKLESPIPPWGKKPIIAVMGAGSLAQVFTTPPTPVEGAPDALEAYLMGFDFDTDAPKIVATTEAFPESPMEVMTPPNADNPTLDGLQKAGGKLIVFHGQSDPVFSFKDTADWHDRLSANNPAASEFVRFYAIPGMPHGQGGNAPDDTDMLGALVTWVEGDEAPDAIEGRFREGNKEAGANGGASRPLCPWPTHAVYKGGDQASAESFACE